MDMASNTLICQSLQLVCQREQSFPIGRYHHFLPFTTHFDGESVFPYHFHKFRFFTFHFSLSSPPSFVFFLACVGLLRLVWSVEGVEARAKQFPFRLASSTSHCLDGIHSRLISFFQSYPFHVFRSLLFVCKDTKKNQQMPHFYTYTFLSISFYPFICARPLVFASDATLSECTTKVQKINVASIFRGL